MNQYGAPLNVRIRQKDWFEQANPRNPTRKQQQQPFYSCPWKAKQDEEGRIRPELPPQLEPIVLSAEKRKVDEAIRILWEAEYQQHRSQSHMVQNLPDPKHLKKIQMVFDILNSYSPDNHRWYSSSFYTSLTNSTTTNLSGQYEKMSKTNDWTRLLVPQKQPKFLAF